MENVGAKVKRRGNSSNHHNRYSLDESVFDSISDKSAYWIGILIADGNVYIPVGENNSPVIELKLKDREHVEKFREFVDSNRPVHDKDGGKYSSLIIHSRRLSESLRRFGVTPRKSLTVTASDELVMNRHFWRGVIDGDGSLYLSKRGQPELKLDSGSWKLCSQFLEFCAAAAPGNNVHITRSSINCYRVHFCGRYAAVIVRELYRDSSVYLDRKYNKSQEILGC